MLYCKYCERLLCIWCTVAANLFQEDISCSVAVTERSSQHPSPVVFKLPNLAFSWASHSDLFAFAAVSIFFNCSSTDSTSLTSSSSLLFFLMIGEAPFTGLTVDILPAVHHKWPGRSVSAISPPYTQCASFNCCYLQVTCAEATQMTQMTSYMTEKQSWMKISDTPVKSISIETTSSSNKESFLQISERYSM